MKYSCSLYNVQVERKFWKFETKIAIVDGCIKLADFQDRLLVELNDKTSFRILFSLKGVPTA